MRKDKDKRHDPAEADELVRLTEELERRNTALEAQLQEQDRNRAALLHLLEELEREHGQVEQARREWTGAFDAIRDPVFVHDANCRIVRANRAYAERAGSDFAGILGRLYWEVFPRRSGPLPQCQIAIEEKQDTVTEEFTLDTGEAFVSRAFVIRDAERHFLYAIHVLEDITEQRRAETERRLLSEALRQSAAGLILLNSDLSFRYANPAACELVGYEPGQLDGLPMAAVVPEGMHERTPVIKTAVDVAGHWTGEVTLAARDGTLIPAYLSASVIADASGKTLAYVGSWLDLRPIRQAQEALAASEARFRLLTENASDLVAVVAADGTLRYVSPSVQRLLGYTPDEIVGHRMADFLHPEETVAAEAAVARSISEPDSSQAMTHRLRCKDGNWRYFETLGRNLLHEPAVGGIVLNSRDITERKLVERALAESEAKFRSISVAALDAVLMIDNDGRLVYWNPAAERIFGYRAQEALGQHVHRLLAPSRYHADIERGFASFRGTGEGAVVGKTLDLVALRKDGSEFPIELSISALRLNDRWHAVGILRDITERQRSEAALRASEEKFRNLVETTTDWIWQIDEHGVYTYASPQVHDILGYGPKEIIGKTPLDLMPPSEAERMREILESIVASQKPFRLLENVNLHKNGRTVVLETSGTPLFDETGAYKGCRGIDRDITARKQAQEALRRSNRALKTLSTCNASLVHAQSEPELLRQICHVIVETGGYAYAWIGYAMNDPEKHIRPMAQEGFEPGFLESLPWSVHGQNPCSTAVREGAMVVARDVANDPALAERRDMIVRLGIGSIASFPLMSSAEAFGMLSIYSRERDAFDRDELMLLAEMAEDLNFGILTLRQRVEHEQLQQEHLKTAERLKETLADTIRAIALTVEKRDPYTAGHQNSVADLCVAIGRELNLPEDRIEGMRLAALIHDIGKIYVPAEILNRPGKLTPAEFEIIKSHPEVGYDIVKDVKFPWPVAETIRQHHERLDGTGYPRGLKGEDIILEARILAVADTVEAMSSHRPYRPAHGIEAALAEIEQHRGDWYDPAVADACLRLLREKGFRFD